jgi:predicted membrane channel-forming protein YqfA (hemolysin III family)
VAEQDEHDEPEGRDGRESVGQPGESEKERVDRELIELLNELRVVLPGVQVLFAFLLTVPFSNGFSRMTNLQRHVYFAAFIGATIATILLIAPSTYHRIMFRRGDKVNILRASNHFAIAGTAFLAAAMSAVVFVITDVLFHATVASIVSGLAAAGFVGTWYGFPLARRLKAGPEK